MGYKVESVFAETWESCALSGCIPPLLAYFVGGVSAVGRSGKAPNVRWWRIENPDKIRFVLRQHRRRYRRRCRD